MLSKPLKPWERDLLNHPERFTFDSFYRNTLKGRNPVEKMSIAEEEFSCYHLNKRDKEHARMILRMDPSDPFNYKKLKECTANFAKEVYLSYNPAERDNIEQNFQNFLEFKDFVNHHLKLRSYLKRQLIKKIAYSIKLDPFEIDEIAERSRAGSTLYYLELYSCLSHFNKLEDFRDFFIQNQKNLYYIASRPSILLPLWEHQKTALTKWKDSGGRGIIEMATATGKTLVGIAAAEDVFRKEKKLRSSFLLIPKPCSTSGEEKLLINSLLWIKQMKIIPKN